MLSNITFTEAPAGTFTGIFTLPEDSVRHGYVIANIDRIVFGGTGAAVALEIELQTVSFNGANRTINPLVSFVDVVAAINPSIIVTDQLKLTCPGETLRFIATGNPINTFANISYRLTKA